MKKDPIKEVAYGLLPLFPKEAMLMLRQRFSLPQKFLPAPKQLLFLPGGRKQLLLSGTVGENRSEKNRIN